MSQTIWKYTWNTMMSPQIGIEMPEGAVIMCANLRESSIGDIGLTVDLHALVDPTGPAETREFLMIGTGHPADGVDALDYIGTIRPGTLVFHIFEVTR